MSKTPETVESTNFMEVLEQGVRDVLKNRKASASDKLAAVTAGTKLLAIRHRIEGDDQKGFFS